MLTYVQCSGRLLDDAGTLLGTGYSGNTSGLDNPAAEDERAVGPLPCGLYTITAPRHPIDHLGPLAMFLDPDPANEMFDRSGFFMHGDNARGNHSASDGCIVMGPRIRGAIAAGYVGKQLRVVAEDADALAA
jgi:Protein of unknown function (DUF2778)